MQLTPHRKVQNWKNESRFLQGRRRDNKDSPTPETILVGLRRDEDGFELLSWAINVAARAGDTVIAFYLKQNGAKVENLIGKLQTESSHDHGAAHSQLMALKELCEAKQIQMDVRFALSGNEELELIEEASSLLATMLVVSPPSRHVLWSSQRKGISLARKVPSGCSVVIVKGYKVLFYNENASRESKDNGSTFADDSYFGTPIWRSKGTYQPFGSLQRQFSCTSSPLWGREEEDEIGLDMDVKVVAGSNIWPVHMGEGSPRGVLDNLGLSSESDLSSPSSTHSSLSHSLSRKNLLSSVSSREDGDDSFREKPQHCLSLRRNRSIRRTSTFPPSSRLKKFSGPLDYTSMRNSFKSYVNTLWGTESISHEAPLPGDGRQDWRCFFYEELTFATSDFNPANIVGKGGHAEVYKGRLLDGRVVAIKRL
eukprot:c23704_g2_i1 orf=292-1566(+)